MYIMVIRVKSHVFIVSSDKDCLAQQGGVNSRDVERKEGIINLSIDRLRNLGHAEFVFLRVAVKCRSLFNAQNTPRSRPL